MLTSEMVVPDSGRLTTYLGSAPGVGKTFAMLQEGQRRAEAGDRVVVAWIELHDRPDTRALLGDLEVIGPRQHTYRGHDFLEPDLPGVLDAQPDVVILDELAHSYPDRQRQRWMDAADILVAGPDVTTSVNVANLVSAREYAARLTGAGTVESVPDEFVRAGEIILIDLPAEVLRRRIAAGSVYSADQVGGALAEYFRLSNLEALSRLSQAWMAGTMEDVGTAILAERGLSPDPPRPVVVAGVSGSSWGEAVIRRGADVACAADADLQVVHVNIADGTVPPRGDYVRRNRELTAEMGGTYTEVDTESASLGLAEVVRSAGAARVVVARHRGRVSELLRGSVASQLRRLLPDISVEEVRDRP
jgi:two-component system sensor histidine kinase KdpD